MNFLIDYLRRKRNNERAETRYALLIANTHRVTPGHNFTGEYLPKYQF